MSANLQTQVRLPKVEFVDAEYQSHVFWALEYLEERSYRPKIQYAEYIYKVLKGYSETEKHSPIEMANKVAEFNKSWNDRLCTLLSTTMANDVSAVVLSYLS
jgi:hypothetical protein